MRNWQPRRRPSLIAAPSLLGALVAWRAGRRRSSQATSWCMVALIGRSRRSCLGL